LLEAILLNQTLPTAHKRRKNPTVTPAHALKTLFRQVIPNKIPDYALQTLSCFMQKPDVYNRRLVYVSPLFTEPPLRYVFSSEDYVQNAIAFIGAYLPVLHLEVKLAKNAHFQSSKVSIQITPLRFWRARERHESQSFTSTFANSQPAH
jgi:hypothetical protein